MAPPAASRSYLQHLLKVTTVVIIFFLSGLPPKADGSLLLNTRKSLEGRKTMIGSKPPDCINKCMNCRPCMATLVIPSYPKSNDFKALTREEEDEIYYHLSWKCKCGDKLFPPGQKN